MPYFGEGIKIRDRFLPQIPGVSVIPNLKIIAAEFRKVLEKQAVQSEKTMKHIPVLLLYRLIRILQHGQSGCFIVFCLKKPSEGPVIPRKEEEKGAWAGCFSFKFGITAGVLHLVESRRGFT
jgi:hypothetical protein